MKKYLLPILTFLILSVFFVYWIAIFIAAMPPSHPGNIIAKNAPRFKSNFGITWKLFTPAYTYNSRLYFLVRDIKNPGKTDTLEVLENISFQKQHNAPFNQGDYIIDHIIHKNLTGIINMVWFQKKKPSPDKPWTTDSTYIAEAIAKVANNKNYQGHLATLNNYCRFVMEEKKIAGSGRAVKIQIKEKMILPFKARDRALFSLKETLVFETSFMPVHP